MYQGIDYVRRYIDVSDNPCYSSDTENLCTLYVRSLAWPEPIPRRGVIAFSISVPLGKGSGMVYSVHSCKDQRMSLSVDWLHDRNKMHAVLYVLKRMKL